jgi:hypothetical protein
MHSTVAGSKTRTEQHSEGISYSSLYSPEVLSSAHGTCAWKRDDAANLPAHIPAITAQIANHQLHEHHLSHTTSVRGHQRNIKYAQEDGEGRRGIRVTVDNLCRAPSLRANPMCFAPKAAIRKTSLPCATGSIPRAVLLSRQQSSLASLCSEQIMMGAFDTVSVEEQSDREWLTVAYTRRHGLHKPERVVDPLPTARTVTIPTRQTGAGLLKATRSIRLVQGSNLLRYDTVYAADTFLPQRVPETVRPGTAA